jgi:hypothetical protein
MNKKIKMRRNVLHYVGKSQTGARSYTAKVDDPSLYIHGLFWLVDCLANVAIGSTADQSRKS